MPHLVRILRFVMNISRKTVAVIGHDHRCDPVADRIIQPVYGRVESDLRPAISLAAGAGA